MEESTQTNQTSLSLEAHNGVRREIIVDSGASKHMIGIYQLQASGKASTRELEHTFLVQTAHGVVPRRQDAIIYIHDLYLWVWAQLLEDSPAVLSLVCPSAHYTPLDTRGLYSVGGVVCFKR